MDIVWDGERLLIAGPDTGPVELRTELDCVGIRFRPGVAPGFLGHPASELRDRRAPLDAFWGRAANELAERIVAAPENAPNLLEVAVLTRVATAAIDTLIHRAVGELRSAGVEGLTVSALARVLAIDERTLHRRCLERLGYGPKTLDRILRFRRAVRLGRTGHATGRAALAAGYADQAHFGRECRRLSGVTPRVLLTDPATIITSDV